jgi:hypothetical protein
MPSEPKGALQEELWDMIVTNGLNQMVNFTTRRDKNGTENTLDLLLTSHPSLISNVRPQAGISDHCIIKANLATKTKLSTKPPRNVPLWRRVDTESFKELVATLASDFFKLDPMERSVEDNWTWFRDSLNELVEKNVPHKLMKGNAKAPWFTSKLKRLCSKKEKFYIRAKKSGKKGDWEKFT